MGRQSYAEFWVRRASRMCRYSVILRRRLLRLQDALVIFVSSIFEELLESERPETALKYHKDFFAKWSEVVLTFIDNAVTLLAE